MACMLYESMLLFGISFVATLAFSVLTQMRSGIDAHRPWLIAFLGLVFGLYFSYCWSKGQTLAMRTWRIRVTDRQGRPLTPARAVFRYACSWLWLLPPIAFIAPMHLSGWGMAGAVAGWMAFWALMSFSNPDRQFLHDLLAGTRLVDAPRHQGVPGVLPAA
ncbi:RDD family protein [Ramlibacter aquaticus]|uniref:RDD family protein n=1 Tax=Ramlibacter aquaticus TaxID=2780094 RepID=A0ABR9SCT5_9BURK|nr:RDD family protein [Ramlibacter aquaticus]